MEPWIEALWEPLEHILQQQTYHNSDSTCKTTADTAVDAPEGTVSVANQEANSSSTGCEGTVSVANQEANSSSTGCEGTVSVANQEANSSSTGCETRHLTPSNSLSGTGAVGGSEGGDLLTQGTGSQAAATPTAADAHTAEDSTSPLTFERALKKCCEALESISLALPTVPPDFMSVKYDEVNT